MAGWKTALEEAGATPDRLWRYFRDTDEYDPNSKDSQRTLDIGLEPALRSSTCPEYGRSTVFRLQTIPVIRRFYCPSAVGPDHQNKMAGKCWPALSAIAILWFIISLLFVASTRQTGQHLVYALDDPYIHMAIAKNFATHGVWGVTRYEFSSSSSSLLWTYLLSLVYSLLGVSELAPLALNMFCATGVIILADQCLSSLGRTWPASYRFLILLAIVFFTPLPALVFTGMEHTLHTLLAILFLWAAAVVIASAQNRTVGVLALAVLAALLSAVRYEGVFMVFVVSALFALRRRWVAAVAVVGAALVPPLVYGLVSVAHGWFVLPNSLLLKAEFGDLNSRQGIVKLLGYAGYERLRSAPHVMVLVAVALLLFVRRLEHGHALWERRQLLLVIYAMTALIHVQFASVGWFFRYEAYLVAAGMLVVAATLLEGVRQKLISLREDTGSRLVKVVAVGILTGLAFMPFAERGVVSLTHVTRATTNIYQQQYQMGLFLKQYYSEDAIAANDIGAINFLADIKCVDLWGLGSRVVGRLRRAREYDVAAMARIAEEGGVRVAVLYDHWFQGIGGIPTHWRKVGEWTIERNVVAGGDTVSFYATASSEESVLTARLRQFESRLPRSVRQSGTYSVRTAGGQ